MIGRLENLLETQGLTLFGGWHPGPDDQLPGRPATVLIVGNIGSAIFTHLQASPEWQLSDPLDRWTRRVLGQIVDGLGAKAVFPFDGPPFHPFQQWALRADGRFAVSPLRMLVHADYGLWTALRGALLFDRELALPPPVEAASPCSTCATRPCLSTCPVDAFQPGHYDLTVCRTHLATLSGQDCMMGGCLARRACPIGRRHAYGRTHAGFHMRAFHRRR